MPDTFHEVNRQCGRRAVRRTLDSVAWWQDLTSQRRDSSDQGSDRVLLPNDSHHVNEIQLLDFLWGIAELHI